MNRDGRLALLGIVLAIISLHRHIEVVGVPTGPSTKGRLRTVCSGFLKEGVWHHEQSCESGHHIGVQPHCRDQNIRVAKLPVLPGHLHGPGQDVHNLLVDLWVVLEGIQGQADPLSSAPKVLLPTPWARVHASVSDKNRPHSPPAKPISTWLRTWTVLQPSLANVAFCERRDLYVIYTHTV